MVTLSTIISYTSYVLIIYSGIQVVKLVRESLDEKKNNKGEK